MKPFEHPQADTRTYDDILTEIEVKAPFYTPHWRFDRKNPDAGSALAAVFANQLAESIKQFNMTPLNHKLSFYNALGGTQNPALSASGIVCFSLSGAGVDGSPIPKDFKLFLPAEDNAGVHHSYETQHELFVTPAELTELIYTDSVNDRLLFREDKEVPFVLSSARNQQSHRLTFTHEVLSRLHDGCRLYIIPQSERQPLWLSRLSNPELVRWTLIYNETEKPLACILTGQRLQLCGIEKCNYITLEILDISAFEDLTFDGFTMELEAEDIIPDEILIKGEVCPTPRFNPFGTAFSIYDDLVIQSDTVLCQKGELITLRFAMGFTILDDGEIPPPSPPKRLFVPKRDVPVVERRDIIIDDVAWEYWNGYGFAPLPGLPGGLFAGLDNMESLVPAQEYTLTFTCPDDICPVLSGAREAYCLRARIRGVRNAFYRPARIFAPWMANVQLEYKTRRPVQIHEYTLMNNGETLNGLLPKPFLRPDSGRFLYFGFDRPLIGGLISILAVCAGNGAAGAEWSVYTGEGWRPLRTEDDTGVFSRTGLIRFTIGTTMRHSTQMGREAYWIRASLSDDADFRIDNLMMNGARVLQCDSVESFCSDSEPRLLQLQHRNIIDARVYINESKTEEENWRELKDGYTLDKKSGQITFAPILKLQGSGRTVRVCYRHGGGADGNVPGKRDFIPSLSIGFVQKAVNPLPLTGGAEAETPEDAQRRIGRILRHGGRPVTPSDYEDIIWENCMAAVKCFPGRRGGVTIVIFMKDLSADFEPVKARALGKLLPVLPLGIGMPEIIPPVLTSVSVEAELGLIGNSLTEAENALVKLCDPFEWAGVRGFGSLPDTGEIHQTFLALQSVVSCKRLIIRYHIGDKEITMPPPFGLPCAGVIKLSHI